MSTPFYGTPGGDYYCRQCHLVPVVIKQSLCPRCEAAQAPQPPQAPAVGHLSSLLLFTIYRRPRDYPDEYVVRRWSIRRMLPTHEGGEPYARGKTLQEVRRALPPGLYNMGRDPADDPVIIETWV